MADAAAKSAANQAKRVGKLVCGTDALCSAVAAALLYGRLCPSATMLYSVLGLWRLRRTDKTTKALCDQLLGEMDRPVAIGGIARGGATAHVEWLHLGTMRWDASMQCPVPKLPCPRYSDGGLSVISWAADPDGHQRGICTKHMGGKVLVLGGTAPMDFERELGPKVAHWSPDDGGRDPQTGARLPADLWLPSEIPPPPRGASIAAALPLTDGSIVVFKTDGSASMLSAAVGGGTRPMHSSTWTNLPPMLVARDDPLVGLLPSGHIVVVGGWRSKGWGAQSELPIPDSTGTGHVRQLISAEIFDPKMRTWSRLPNLGTGKCWAGDVKASWSSAGCVLPSGRFAVVGKLVNWLFQTVGAGQALKLAWTAEGQLDPAGSVWEPLPTMGSEWELGPQRQTMDCMEYATGPPASQQDCKDIAHTSLCLGAVAVPGGLIAVGNFPDTIPGQSEMVAASHLYDEATDEWHQLPANMVFPRTSLPGFVTVSHTAFPDAAENMCSPTNEFKAQACSTCGRKFQLAQCPRRRATINREGGSRRLEVNRDMCELHRPRRCKYGCWFTLENKSGTGPQGTCGRCVEGADDPAERAHMRDDYVVPGFVDTDDGEPEPHD